MAKLHRRRYIRQALKTPAWVFDGAGQYPCVVLDVSEAGMKLDLLGREPDGDSFSVFLSAQEPMALVRIQWRDGSVVGVQMA